MKWKRWQAVVLCALIVSLVAVPIAAAQAPADAAQEPQSEERRIVDLLKRARSLRGTMRGSISALGVDGFEVTVGHDADASEIHIVAVNDETIYRLAGQEEATFADLQVDDLVVVRLVPESENLAQSVAVVTGRQMRAIDAGQRILQAVQRLLGHSARCGEIVAIGPQSITLETAQGQVVLVLSDESKIMDAEGQEIALGDLQVGDVISVVGRPDPTAPINAGQIRLLPERPAQD